MPELFGPEENAWHRLPKHLSQIGIAPAASKLNMQTMFSDSCVCAVLWPLVPPGCQYQNIIASYWYWALYFKNFHQPSMKALVLLFGLVYIRQQSVSVAVTALGVAAISSHQPVCLSRGAEMSLLWDAFDGSTAREQGGSVCAQFQQLQTKEKLYIDNKTPSKHNSGKVLVWI